MPEITLKEMKDLINSDTNNIRILTFYDRNDVHTIKPGIKQICTNLGITIPKFVCMDAKYNHNKTWAFAFDESVDRVTLNNEIYKVIGVKTREVDDLNELVKKHVPVRCSLHE